jgi:hypothetical protein
MAHLRARQNFPEVSCDDCFEAQRLDGTIPPCQTVEGCWIPPLDRAGSRALEIHKRLRDLSELGIGDGVLRIYNAGKFDLELIALAETALRPISDTPQPQPEE